MPKAWQKKINHIAETLPDLYAPREVRMYKTGNEILQHFDRKALKDFKEGLKQDDIAKAKAAGKPVPITAGEIVPGKRYTYIATVMQPIDHRKRMRAIYRKHGMTGVAQYVTAVNDKKAELDAGKLFKKRNRFYLRWYRSIKEQLARASRVFTKGAGKPA